MAWVLQDEKDRSIISEIEKQSDRGAIVVAISFLERRLEETIKTRLIENIDPELNGKIFKGYGPLASFAAKIDIGLLLFLYPNNIAEFLHKLREIRNDAAHETIAISFELQTIRDRCKSLLSRLHDDFWLAMEHRLQLGMATKTMPSPTGATMLYKDGLESQNFSLQLDPPTTKEQFFVLIKAMVFHLHEVKAIFERTRLALPPLPDTLGSPPTRPARAPSRARKEPQRPR